MAGESMLNPLKRWPVLLALVVVLGGLAVGLPFLPGGRVTRENCERIKEGMTEAEVPAILGKPWDDSLLDPEGPGDRDAVYPLSVYETLGSCSYWMGSNVGICVIFDRRGRAIFTQLCTDPDRPRSSLPGRVWRRLRARYGW
jgi:hypothetical protein